MKRLIEHAKSVVEKYPSLKTEVQGLIDLCVAEIEEGGSQQHEISLCWSDIDELVKEQETN